MSIFLIKSILVICYFLVIKLSLEAIRNRKELNYSHRSYVEVSKILQFLLNR